MKDYDVIIIGSGQGGGPLARKMALAGKRTALIEKRFIGGTCINDGCTPTKTWVASAKMAFMAGRSNELGVLISDYKIDMAAIKDRKDQIVQRFRSGSEDYYSKTPNLDLIYGEAFFTGHKAVSVKLNAGGELSLKAGLIFINIGCKPHIPVYEGLNNINYLTSTSILDLDIVPDHLLIIGSGYIGLEFGQMFNRFGSKITLLERGSRIAAHEDEDVSHELQKIMEAEGMTIMTNTIALNFETGNDRTIQVTIKTADTISQSKFSHVLIASGRRPETAPLMLHKTGLQTDAMGYIPVNDQLETIVEGIYALGDVNGGPAYTHISYHDYTIIFRNLLEGGDFNTGKRLVPYCLFTDPQLGRIGINEKDAKNLNIRYKVVKLSMTNVARAIETGDTRGFIKAIINLDNGQILGAAVLCQEGGELMTILQMAMYAGITYDQIRYFIFAHPLYAEAFNNLFIQV